MKFYIARLFGFMYDAVIFIGCLFIVSILYTTIALFGNIKFIPYAVDYRSSNFFHIINFYQRFSVSNNLSSFDIFFRELLGILAIKLFY